jgi:hypothetical protein
MRPDIVPGMAERAGELTLGQAPLLVVQITQVRVFARCFARWLIEAGPKIEVQKCARQSRDRRQYGFNGNSNSDRRGGRRAPRCYRSRAEPDRGERYRDADQDAEHMSVVVICQSRAAAKGGEPSLMLDSGSLCNDRPPQGEHYPWNDESEKAERYPNGGDDLGSRDDR